VHGAYVVLYASIHLRYSLKNLQDLNYLTVSWLL